jgi:propanediol dehydratase small subunit
MTPDERKRRLDALYPVGEKRTDTVRSRSGRPLADIGLQRILSGELDIDDIGISADGLTTQAEIARLAGRETLARNFERAAEW